MQLLVKDKAFYKKIQIIAIPVILQGMISAGVGMMDTLMVGKLGEIQLSAVSLANQFLMIFMIMCFGLGFGAAVLTSRFYGSKNILALKKIVTIMLRIALTIGTAFTILTLMFPDSIMNLYTPDRGIIDQGVLYFQIIALSYLCMAVTFTLTAVFRSVGQVRLPLITSIVTFFTNIFFNYMFIFGKFGAPALGIRGAALGTLIARVIEALIIGGYFLMKDERISYRVKDILLSSKEYLPIYVSMCLPVLVSDTFMALGMNIVAVIMGHIGVSFVAAFAIMSQITRMTTVFNQGVSNASAIITGQTLGEGDTKKAFDQGVSFVTLSLILGIIAAVVILVISPLVISMFDVTVETYTVAHQLKYAVAIMIIFQTLSSTLTKGVLRGGGDTKFLMIGDVLFLWIASIPLGYLTGIVWALPAFWVYVALKSEAFFKTIWCLKRLASGKWIKKVEHPHEQASAEAAGSSS